MTHVVNLLPWRDLRRRQRLQPGLPGGDRRSALVLLALPLMLLPRLTHRLLALLKRGEQLRVGRRVKRRQEVALQTRRSAHQQAHPAQQHNADG